jgi:uroporphyrinogen III methyltransferase/synthase
VAGVVYLVGAGPGDPGLLTRRGAEVLATADVVVFDGLVAPALLDLCRPTAERIYAGKKRAPAGHPLGQDAINRLLVERALRGERVVRLKGGDPFVFGRGAEECLVLAEAGVRFEIVPGVTAATAVAAYAGIPLTARGVAATCAFATGHEAEDKDAGAIDWRALAGASTIVLYMAVKTADECCARLVAAGRAATTPAAAIAWGTRPEQRTVVATLGDLPAAIAAAGLGPPALLVIGDVVAMRDALSWREARPLHGVRVAATRDAADGARFAAAVGDLGGEAIFLPVTRIAPVDGAGPALVAALATLERADWILFASRTAVELCFAALRAGGRDARALGGRVGSVGAATTAALLRAGVVPDLEAEVSSAAGLAAAVLTAGDVRDRRVILPRAADGRDDGAERLAAAGARVEPIALYRTEAIAPDDPALAPGLAQLRRGAVGGLAVFAPSQARALVAALGPDSLAILGRVPRIAAIGETTREALVALGVRVDAVPARPEVDALAAALASA